MSGVVQASARFELVLSPARTHVAVQPLQAGRQHHVDRMQPVGLVSAPSAHPQTVRHGVQ